MSRKRFLALGLLVMCLLWLALAPSLRASLLDMLSPRLKVTFMAWRNQIQVDHDIVIVMSDGVRLSASLYLPSRRPKPMATVLIRLPYHRLRYSEGINAAIFFARHGYAVLVQDLRGSGDSEGELLPWRGVAEDGVTTLDWIIRQDWSTGKVGTFGCSALGETQLVLAKKNHPAHAAMIPSGAGGAVGSAAGRFGYFGVFEGGVFQLASGFGWFADHGAKPNGTLGRTVLDRAQVLQQLPVADLLRGIQPKATGFEVFLSTQLGAPVWENWGYISDADQSDVPSLVINTWGDQTVGDALALAEFWRQRGHGQNQRVIIAPGDHCHREDATEPLNRWGALPVSNSSWPREQWSLRWFEHWLRGVPDNFADIQAFNFFMLVENRWYRSTQWPPEQAEVESWQLTSSGNANSRTGNGRLGPTPASVAAFDSFRYDPSKPVPSRGGPVCCTGNPLDRSGPADQVDVETREDVLVYTSTPMEADLRIAGPLRARLTVSADVPDTDLIVRLVHVRPDGLATGIQEGALRLRYRDGFAVPVPMQPGQRYQVTVDLRSIAYMVPRGHRLRVHVTGSSFPRLERNLNTGALNNAAEKNFRVAQTKIHYGPGATSLLELPVIRSLN